MTKKESVKDWKIEDRWNKGIPHNEDAEITGRLIGDVDFCHFNDYFEWRFGGDGDNGECLIYLLDELFDRGILTLNKDKILK